MADPLSFLESELKKLKESALPSKVSPWLSRKLIVSVVLGGVLLFIGITGTGATIVAGLTWLGIAYLFSQAVPDAVKEWQIGQEAVAKREWDARVKIAEIEALGKDGLDAEDKARMAALALAKSE